MPSPPADASPAELVLEDHPYAARLARHFVRDRLAAHVAPGVLDDATLVTSELVANAQQHGRPPVVLRLELDGERVRIEVSDASTRLPVRSIPGASHMTGRGIALVEACSARWGVRRGDVGKVIWCEFGPGGTPAAGRSDPTAVDRRERDGWADGSDSEERFTVGLGDVPTALLIEAKAHVDNLVREFSLASAGAASRGLAVPTWLAELMDVVVDSFGEARSAIKAQAVAAARRNEIRTSLELRLPLSAADAGVAYLAALDEADTFSRAARLLTLETPAEHRVFRHWYVEAVIDQLRQAARGEPLTRAQPFEERLLQEVHRLAREQRHTEGAARLQRVTAALARTRSPAEVAGVVVFEGVDALGASGGSLLTPTEDGRRLSVPGSFGYADDVLRRLQEEATDAPLPAATALRTGEPIWLESRQERDELFPALRGFEPTTVAMCAVPLQVGDRLVGALRFSFDSPRLFDDAERNFILALAAQTAQTLDRTRAHQTDRTTAIQLQRALLPPIATGVPGWDIAAHYSPAGEHEVGGDWYDVLPLPDGRLVATVGDVMGRGVAAAAAMAQMRAAVRAYASVDPTPSIVLTKLDTMLETVQSAQLVTILYALFDRDTVTVASAGHLPPVLLRPGRPAEAVGIVPGPPIGVGSFDRASTEVAVPPGAALLVVTDGLVERRGEDIDLGMERLVDSARLSEGDTSEHVVHRVLATAAEQRVHDDDVTVLVVRRHTDP